MTTFRPSRKRRPLAENDLTLARIPKPLWEASLSTATFTPAGLAALVEYCTNIEQHVDAGHGFVLWGANGTGKTFAAVAIMKESIRHGYGALWLTAQEVVDLKFSQECTIYGTPLRERAAMVDMLIIDDLGKEHLDPGGYAARQLEQLLRTRVHNGLVTMITTNMNPDDIARQYKASMVEVLTGKIKYIKVSGANRREDTSW